MKSYEGILSCGEGSGTCYGYDFHLYRIKKYTENSYKHIFLKEHLRSYRDSKCSRKYVKKNTVNEDKLLCNMSRARQKMFEWAMCNEWNFFVTLTLDKKKYDRYDLGKYIVDLSRFIRHYRERLGVSVKYLLIPERHKDGAWHLHGFFKGFDVNHLTPFNPADKLPKYIRRKLRRGEEIYNWLPYAVKFGWVIVEPIRNHEACCKYITKYITKDMSKTVSDIGAHMYYVSKGLNRSTVVYEESSSDNCKTVEIAFENEYCMIGWRNFLTDEEIKMINDYNANKEYIAFMCSLEPPIIVPEEQVFYVQLEIGSGA